MLPTYFKMASAADSGVSVLRPQGKSFVSGCQMKSINESAEKNGGAGGPSKPPPNQRRPTDTKESR